MGNSVPLLRMHKPWVSLLDIEGLDMSKPLTAEMRERIVSRCMALEVYDDLEDKPVGLVRSKSFTALEVKTEDPAKQPPRPHLTRHNSQ